MEGENFDDSCEISDVEDELDFALLADDLSEIELEDHLEIDSDDSDVIVVRKKRRIAIIESDLEDKDTPSVDGDVRSNITGSDIPLEKINFSTGNKIPRPQVFNIEEPLQFFKLYFTEELVDEIVSETNSYAKSTNKKPLYHLKFVKRLVDQLVGEFFEDRSRPSTSATETRLDKKLHILRKGKKRDCIVCSNRQEKG